jgi:uncharacterized protein
MLSLSEIKNTLSKHKNHLSEKQGPQFMAILGSYSRQVAKQESDIDIMVDFERPVGVEFIYLDNELEKIPEHEG